MLHTGYLSKRGSSFLISKLHFKSSSQLPSFLSGELVIWFNIQQYKKVIILIFILLNVLTKVDVSISKKKNKCFFSITINLEFILNLIVAYLSNIDITLNHLLLNTGQHIIGIFLSYNKIPIIPELDSFFEQVINLLEYLEDSVFSLHLYLHTYTIIGAETYLRSLKVPLFLPK